MLSRVKEVTEWNGLKIRKCREFQTAETVSSSADRLSSETGNAGRNQECRYLNSLQMTLKHTEYEETLFKKIYSSSTKSLWHLNHTSLPSFPWLPFPQVQLEINSIGTPPPSAPKWGLLCLTESQRRPVFLILSNSQFERLISWRGKPGSLGLLSSSTQMPPQMGQAENPRAMTTCSGLVTEQMVHTGRAAKKTRGRFLPQCVGLRGLAQEERRPVRKESSAALPQRLRSFDAVWEAHI